MDGRNSLQFRGWRCDVVCMHGNLLVPNAIAVARPEDCGSAGWGLADAMSYAREPSGSQCYCSGGHKRLWICRLKIQCSMHGNHRFPMLSLAADVCRLARSMSQCVDTSVTQGQPPRRWEPLGGIATLCLCEATSNEENIRLR